MCNFGPLAEVQTSFREGLVARGSLQSGLTMTGQDPNLPITLATTLNSQFRNENEEFWDTSFPKIKLW